MDNGSSACNAITQRGDLAVIEIIWIFSKISISKLYEI